LDTNKKFINLRIYIVFNPYDIIKNIYDIFDIYVSEKVIFDRKNSFSDLNTIIQDLISHSKMILSFHVPQNTAAMYFLILRHFYLQKLYIFYTKYIHL
jgi:hypothetical protein